MTQPFPFHEATLSAVTAHNGEIVLHYHPLGSQWVGLMASVVGLVGLIIGTAVASRRRPWRAASPAAGVTAHA